MKSIVYALVIIASLGLCVYTNPTLEDYENFVHQKILREVKEESNNQIDQMVGGFLGNIASKMISNQTVRKDYIFFSSYDTNLGNERLRSIGALRNFIILENPPSFEETKTRK